ncbi:MAG TPA: hypothetical protein VFE62_04360 [Gemmataceae bacterium]|nr:hypothetical protein [Gemmataceae bacterium]
MKIEHLTFSGPAIDDPEMLAKVPKELADILGQVNGFVQFHGGLHVRGACLAPAWHSLRDAWIGTNAFHQLYPDVEPDDVPFAEDCMGDQFLLRDGMVWHLLAETGEMESLESTFKEFFQNVEEDPGEHLGLHPLLQYQREGGHLQPGQLLAAYPPFCLEEAEDGVTLRALPSEERRRFLAEFAKYMRDLPDGSKIDIRWTRP